MRMRILLVTSIVGAATTALSDFDPPKSLATMSGKCSVLIAGTDVGCTEKAAHSVLSNGRHLFNFPAKDLAGVGFAGSDVVRYDPKNPILWVDRVYINDTASDADGQCSYSVEDGDQSFYKAECKALLHDGRKVSASIEGKADTPLAKDKVAENDQTMPTHKGQSDDCDLVVKLHGMLTRAQFQCRFNGYNPDLIKQASACSEKIGEYEFRKGLASGMSNFDFSEKKRGHKQVCSDILRDFSQYIRR